VVSDTYIAEDAARDLQVYTFPVISQLYWSLKS